MQASASWPLKAVSIQSTEDLRHYKDRWADLWARSLATNPTFLMDHFHAYKHRFHAQHGMHSIMVQKPDGSLAGGLIMLKCKRRLGLQTAELPMNDWGECGGILIDKNEDKTAVIKTLVSELHKTRTPLIEWQGIRKSGGIGSALVEATEEGKAYLDINPSHQTGVIDVSQDWTLFLSGLSKNMRKNLLRRERRLSELGKLEFHAYATLSPQDVETFLMRGFQLEARGWKGRSGSAVMQNPQALKFYIDQAKILAAEKRLRVFYLTLDNELIAFEYGWCAKQHYHSNKTTYHEDYAKLSPGQLLFGKVLHYYSKSEHYTYVDVQGPLTPAIEAWHPEPIDIVNANISVKPLGRTILKGYDDLKSFVKPGGTKRQDHLISAH